ncbi:MAG: 2OG-Fe(II) oxygenase [Alphaproteobacteria bacterium]|nr:2OG-Fe(II) oxygenase [Alphaproteobacteria bacterium]
MLHFEHMKLDYEPYPVGLIPGVLDAAAYDALLAAYPPVDLFRYMPKLGNKYSLSSSNHRELYYRFLADTPVWARFHDYILSKDFIEQTFQALAENHIDLGLKRYRVVSGKRSNHANAWSRLTRTTELSARFEFSMMNGVGGHIRPHTDTARKIVTFVFSMVVPGEWEEGWGGGTTVVRPKDPSNMFNRVNRYLDFEDVDEVKTFPFLPNQALIFVKTFNSWHAVMPMTAPRDDKLRKTITINIESKR